MTKFTALILRPIVYILDLGIALTGQQTFKQANAASKSHLKRILNGNGKAAIAGEALHQTFTQVYIIKKTNHL